MIVALVAVVGSVLLFVSHAATPATYDLLTFFPNSNYYKANFLVGTDYVPTTAPAVLWFEYIGNNQFRMYNSSPSSSTARCSYDQFTWNNTSIIYTETKNTCNGANTDVKYSKGIVYMPRDWSSVGSWTQSGTSPVTYTASTGSCTGAVSWTANVPGFVTIAPGVNTIQTQTVQTTTWATGSDPVSGCGTGVVTHYQDNLYLYNTVKGSNGGTAKGVKRSVGGNLDRYNSTGKWDWDIWFNNWQTLPKVS